MSEAFWRSKASWWARRTNFAWWLSRFLPLLFALTVLFAGGALLFRSRGFTFAPLVLSYVELLTVAALIALLLVRRRWCTTQDALVRFDEQLGLQNRLVSAAAAVGAWPRPKEQVHDGTSWRWSIVLPPMIASMLLVFSAFFVPLPHRQETSPPEVLEPTAWSQVEESLETLDEEETISDEDIKNFEQQLDELREQPQDQWYSHDSLEAGDSLREQLQAELSRLERSLQRAEDQLSKIERLQPGSAEEKRALQEWQSTLQRVERNKLSLDPRLMKRLKQIDASKLKKLSKEELRQLKDQLARAQGACQQARDGKENNNASSNRPGKGGISRGPGEAPLTLRPDEAKTDTERYESMAGDPDRVVPGDVVELSEKEHEVDQSYRGPVSGKSTQSAGAGGETVWRGSYSPEEQEFLKRYFR